MKDHQHDDRSSHNGSPHPDPARQPGPSYPPGRRRTPWVRVGAVLAWSVAGVAIANDSSRGWLLDHASWATGAGVAVLGIIAVALLPAWVRGSNMSARAALLIAVGIPLVMVAFYGVFFRMPPEGQLITLRVVTLVVLVITPVLMWWLFLNNQRASLLNEFLANLHRLGLLDPLPEGVNAESRAAREVRVSSYLQRFEGTYGRLPKEIHRDVARGRCRAYSTEQLRDQAPLATAAVPVFLAVLVLAVGWLLVLPPLDLHPEDPTQPRWLLALSPNPTPVTFAFLGAYFFAIQMLFRRYLRADLRGSAYIAVVMRVLLAMIGVWVITGVVEATGWQTQSQLLLLGFVIGVFPTVAWQVVTRLVSKKFLEVVPSLESRLPLNRLDGLTVWHESRLVEEDIENVQNMATADIVDLLVNTKIPAGRIVDWVDQAILLVQLGPDEADNKNRDSSRRRLARHGIRTASGLLKAAGDKNPGPEAAAFASVLVDDEQRPAVPSLLSASHTCSNLSCVLRWRGIDPGTVIGAHPAAAPAPTAAGVGT